MKEGDSVGKRSRDKGKRGELELAHKLQALGYPDAHRSQQYCGGAWSADVIGLPSVHIECKRAEHVSLYRALEQAEQDSEGSSNVPVVMHRKNGKPWLVVMRLEDWSEFYKVWEKWK